MCCNTTTAWPRLWVLVKKSQSVSGVQTVYGSDKQCRGGANWIAVIFSKALLAMPISSAVPIRGSINVPCNIGGITDACSSGKLRGGLWLVYAWRSVWLALTLSGFAQRSARARKGSRSLFAPWEDPFKIGRELPASEERAGANAPRPRRRFAQQTCRECEQTQAQNT